MKLGGLDMTSKNTRPTRPPGFLYSFKRLYLLTPVVRKVDRFFFLVIIGHHHNFSLGQSKKSLFGSFVCCKKWENGDSMLDKQKPPKLTRKKLKQKKKDYTIDDIMTLGNKLNITKNKKAAA